MHNLFRNTHFKHWAGILGILALSVFSVSVNSSYFQASVLTKPSAAPFDGTVYPIQKVPDWSNTSSSEQDMKYSEISSAKLISIPEYRNDYLTYDSSKLVWGNASDNIIRNTKITYPVAYAGTYDLGDEGENSGSHPAIDIKCLEGTPVVAIANGVVYKSSYDAYGYGNYIVIQHDGVPDPNNSNSTTTLYSGYAHLSKSYVTSDEVVVKGQVIGEAGGTGAATTDHVHFQIDNSSAPWHLYWPFTSSEASAAGYDFWDAVSAGVGIENVYKYTINPLEYIKKYANYSGSSSSSSSSSSTTTSTDSSTSNTSTTTESSVVTVDFSDIEFELPGFLLVNSNEEIELTLKDSNGNTVTNPAFTGQIDLSVSDEDLGNISQTFLKTVDFSNGKAKIRLYAYKAGSVTIKAEISQNEFESKEVSFINEIKPFSRFTVVSDGMFTPKIAEKVQVQALDENGDLTLFNNEGTIHLSTSMGSGTFSNDSLTKEDFVNGIAEVEFYGSDTKDVIIVSEYGKAKAESRTIKAKLFTDVSSADDNYNAIVYLYKKGTVQGYADGSYKPTVTVSRVEALKFIYSGLDKTTKPELKVSFKDAFDGQWYSIFVATATYEGILQGYPDGTVKPSQGVNRVEFLKMLINSIDVSVNPVVLENPAEDVNSLDWHAPYVQYAFEKNIFPIEGSRFYPGNPMSRAEVAEVIYRMLKIKETGAEKYSILLDE